MFPALPIKKKILRGIFAALFACAPVISTTAAHAEPGFTGYALQQALDSNDHVNIYNSQGKGFNLNSSYFSGTASGAPLPNNESDFNADQKLYALLIDGRYDFNYEAPALSSPLHPYISGGMGMASLGNGVMNNISGGNGSAVPLFRLGGGVAYRLDPRWNLSLDYKAGVATSSAGDQVFTGRGQESVDMQTLNFGMHYDF